MLDYTRRNVEVRQTVKEVRDGKGEIKLVASV